MDDTGEKARELLQCYPRAGRRGLNLTHSLGRKDAEIGAHTGLPYNRSKSKYVDTDASW